MNKSTLHFTKMHGLGNDFIVITALDHPLSLAREDIVLLANRHFGIGCDQVLIINRASDPNADFACQIFNADGSEAEQCGNGLRCVARWLHENKITLATTFTLQTIAGLFPVTMEDYDHIRITFESSTFSKPSTLKTSEGSFEVDLVSLGNPHAILFTNTVFDDKTIVEIAQQINQQMTIRGGVNVGFAHVIDKHHVTLRTYERGVGLTQACGSNAAATAMAGIERDLLQSPVNIQFAHGHLTISWDKNTNQVNMSGPASSVFFGTIDMQTIRGLTPNVYVCPN